MKQFIMIATIAVSPVLAGEKFIINQENCNLPMKKIRQIVPDRAKQQEIFQACTKKAAKEKWMIRTLVSK